VTVVERIEAAYKRLEKARKLVADGKVHKLIGDGEGYAVEGSDGSRVYYVNGSCGCEDYRRHTKDGKPWWCKHKLAVEIAKQQRGGINGDRNAQGARRLHPRAER